MTWTPETNRIATGLLTDEEKAALRACKHGWEASVGPLWLDCSAPKWHPATVYRAKPAPKRIVTWYNVYRDWEDGGFSSRAVADANAWSNRICVYRIERNEDGSDPQIEVEDV